MKKAISLLIIAFFLISCTDDEGESGVEDTFDRGAMLTNLADNIIVPGFENLSTSTQEMVSSKDNFISNLDQASLDALRTDWFDAYSDFQRVAMFFTGPSENNRLVLNLNTYPTDVNQLNENIIDGTSLSLSSTTDEQGFPALDYLLYGTGTTDQDILAFYSTTNNAIANREYLSRVVDRINELSNEVTTAWQTSFRDTFVNSSGTSATSSVNRIVNDYIEYYETRLRTGKIGNAAGIFTGIPRPDLVESLYYGEGAKELLEESLDAVQDFFNGGTTGNRIGLSNYLDELGVMNEGQLLSTRINNQFETAKDEIDDLSDDFQQQIITDNTEMLQAHDALQANVVLLKVDMISALNIALDFNENDGD